MEEGTRQKYPDFQLDKYSFTLDSFNILSADCIEVNQKVECLSECEGKCSSDGANLIAAASSQFQEGSYPFIMDSPSDLVLANATRIGSFVYL